MKSGKATEIVMDLASQQWGLVTTAQATAEGVSAVALGRLVDRAVLTRIRSGVYATTSTPSSPEREIRGQWLALKPAVLAADRLDDPHLVVVSHESAALMHRIGDLYSHGVHFTASSRRQTRQPDVVFHTAEVPASDWTVVGGLPVTTSLRTVVDLARAGHEPGHLVDMLADVFDQHLATREEATDALIEVAEIFGISRADRAGVSAWLAERFPDTGVAGEEMFRRELEAALAPLRKQLEALAQQVSLPLMSDEMVRAFSHDANFQREVARMAKQFQAGLAPSVPPELLSPTSPSSSSSDSSPPDLQAGPGPGGQDDPDGPDDTDTKEHG